MQGEGGVTAKQIKKIHTLKSKLKMSDDDYRLLLSDYWVDSSKKLTHDEAKDLIKRLEKTATEKGVWSRYSNRGKMRYAYCNDRPGYATGAQLRMIEAMWRDVSTTHNVEHRQRALRKFIFRIVGVTEMEAIESHQVQKLVNAMRHMQPPRPMATPPYQGGELKKEEVA